MSSPDDTTTTLNAGTGGDVMNESLVTQSDGLTQAKSPRVVLISDDGALFSSANPITVELSSADRERFDDLLDLMAKLVVLNGGLA